MTGICYEIRESEKARRLQISVLPQGKLEVVVPSGFNRRRIPAFIHQHRDWIQRTLDKYEQQRMRMPELYTLTPEKIELKALDKSWQVQYDFIEQLRASEITHNRRICTLDIRTRDENTATTCLRTWLKHMAKRELKPWLDEISGQTGLVYHGVTIRAQKTRWGSCTHQKKINLNQNLLFLPKPLVEYLFIHELCHTIHLNHSKSYWALVARHCKNYRELDSELSKANRQIPLWALAQ